MKHLAINDSNYFRNQWEGIPVTPEDISWVSSHSSSSWNSSAW